jgi:hypothetical protein
MDTSALGGELSDHWAARAGRDGIVIAVSTVSGILRYDFVDSGGQATVNSRRIRGNP